MPSWLVVSWYASKMWEWGDTLVLVARCRPIGRLHYVHHMSTASLVALQTVGRASQTPLFEVGTALNAFAHVWMYAYYAHPGAWPSPLRTAITCMQVAQHGIMCACLLYSFAAQDGCDRDATHNLVPMVLYAFFLIEFARLLLPGRGRTGTTSAYARLSSVKTC